MFHAWLDTNFSWCSTSQSCMNSFDSLKVNYVYDKPISSFFQCSEFMRVTYGYDCPFQPHDQFPYLDLFARSRALPFISAANSKSPEMLSACLRSNIPNIRVISVKQVPCDPICVGNLHSSISQPSPSELLPCLSGLLPRR